MMKDDPAIERVRETRHKISEECDHDARKLVAHYRKRAADREKQRNMKAEGGITSAST